MTRSDNLAVLNGRVGLLMAELAHTKGEYRDVVQADLEQAQEALATTSR